jgi:magnesium transporter
MIRTLLYHPVSGKLSAGGEELLSGWRQEPETILWADFSDEPPDQEQQVLEASFGLHALAIQDAQRERHPPKLESFDGYSFLLLKELSPHAETFDFASLQLALFVGERFLITRHAGASPGVDQLFAQAARNTALFDQGPGALAMRLCRTLVDRYLRILLELEPRLEELERVLMENPDDTILAELLGYKTELKKFRRVFLYHEQMFRELRSRPFPALGAEIAHQVTDVYEQQERAGSLAGLYYEMASDMADGYISVASHHLNQIMKILTVVMSIFIPLSFLAGIYGMNFEYMPELHSRSGYFILLGVMGAIAFLLISLFRRKRWL